MLFSREWYIQQEHLVPLALILILLFPIKYTWFLFYNLRVLISIQEKSVMPRYQTEHLHEQILHPSQSIYQIVDYALFLVLQSMTFCFCFSRYFTYFVLMSPFLFVLTLERVVFLLHPLLFWVFLWMKEEVSPFLHRDLVLSFEVSKLMLKSFEVDFVFSRLEADQRFGWSHIGLLERYDASQRDVRVLGSWYL